MNVRRHLFAVVGIIVLVGASWACEQVGNARMNDAVQRQWNCWAEETATNPACVRDQHLVYDDADWCLPAVNACRAKGFYRAVDDAEVSWRRWWVVVAGLRWLALLMLAALVCSVGWRGLKQLVAWRRPSSG